MCSVDDVILNKSAIIERCLARVEEEYKLCPQLDNYTHLDALILNLERSCQAAIDIAMHIVAKDHLGIPQGSADAFTLLARKGLIEGGLAKRLRGMVGFRNIAVHEYQGLEIGVVRYIVDEGVDDFRKFCHQLGTEIR